MFVSDDYLYRPWCTVASGMRMGRGSRTSACIRAVLSVLLISLGGFLQAQIVARPHDPRAILPNLIEWWSARDRNTLRANVLGTLPVNGEGDPIAFWRGKVRNTVLTSFDDGETARFREHDFGQNPCVEFTGGQQGLVGPFVQDFGPGLTVIVLWRFTDPSTEWRGIVSASSDMVVPSYDTPNGFMFGTSGITTMAGWERQNVFVAATIPSLEPTMSVLTLNQTIRGPVYLEGFTNVGGIEKQWVNGGYPVSEAFYQDQSPIRPGVISIGSMTHTRYSNLVEIGDVFVLSGECSPSRLQALVDQWIKPTYGANTFTLEQFPVDKYVHAGILSGPGLNVFYGKAPLADLGAMGIKWVRIDVSKVDLTDAAIDELIHYYSDVGLKVSWLLPVVPVVDGAYRNPTSIAQHICDRYAALGYGTAFVELGNEAIQLNYPPGGNGFPNEFQAEIAYGNLLNDFMSAMEDYDCIVCGLNDEPAYVYKTYMMLLTTHARMPDCWGAHGYSIGAGNMPGTMDLLAEATNRWCVMTEGNIATSNVSLAMAVYWCETLYANMNGRPWIYYMACDPFYNVDNYAYAWYSHVSEPDENGIPSYSNRTPTLLRIADDLGIMLK